MATTMTLLEFSRLWAPHGSNFPMWQEHLMACLESAESTSELSSRIQRHYEGRNKRSSLHLLRQMNLIDGKGEVLWLSPPRKKL